MTERGDEEIKHVMCAFKHINGEVQLIGFRRNNKLTYSVVSRGNMYFSPDLDAAIKVYMQRMGEIRPVLNFGPLVSVR